MAFEPSMRPGVGEAREMSATVHNRRMELLGLVLVFVPSVVLGSVLIRAGMRATAVAAGTWIISAALLAVLGAAAASLGIPAYLLLWPAALGAAGVAGWLIVRPDDTAAWVSLAGSIVIMALAVIGVITSSPGFHFGLWILAGFAAAALYFSDAYLRAHGK